MIKHRKFLEEHDLRMEKIAREREDRLKKNGGAKIKAVLEPTPQGRALAQALLVEEFPDIETKIVMGKEVFSTAALAIASDAKVRMRNSEGGLSLSEATQQAFAAAKERGDLETIPGAKRDIFGGQFTEGKSVTKFVGGNSPETPMSLPTSVKDGKASVDATKLKAGRFYRRSDGAVAKWTGKGFILATPKAAASRPATPESSDDTGDEDME